MKIPITAYHSSLPLISVKTWVTNCIGWLTISGNENRPGRYWHLMLFDGVQYFRSLLNSIRCLCKASARTEHIESHKAHVQRLEVAHLDTGCDKFLYGGPPISTAWINSY